jgi:hypothetical protein
MNRLPLVKFDETREIIAKRDYAEAASTLLYRVREFAGPGESAVILRSIANIANEAADKVTDEIISGDHAGTYLGAKVEVVRTPAKYDYKACGDPVLGDMEARAEALKKEIKDRQAFLRAIGGEVKDASGEIVRDNTVLVQYVDPAGENATATVHRAPLLEQGQTVKITLPK